MHGPLDKTDTETGTNTDADTGTYSDTDSYTDSETGSCTDSHTESYKTLMQNLSEMPLPASAKHRL